MGCVSMRSSGWMSRSQASESWQINRLLGWETFPLRVLKVESHFGNELDYFGLASQPQFFGDGGFVSLDGFDATMQDGGRPRDAQPMP